MSKDLLGDTPEERAATLKWIRESKQRVRTPPTNPCVSNEQIDQWITDHYSYSMVKTGWHWVDEDTDDQTEEGN
jgi:hypothetical protein